MTMIDVDAAEKAAQEECPCRHGGGCICGALIYGPACKCWAESVYAEAQDERPRCRWSGHAAIRDLRRKAFNAGLEEAAVTVELSSMLGDNARRIRAIKDRP